MTTCGYATPISIGLPTLPSGSCLEIEALYLLIVTTLCQINHMNSGVWMGNYDSYHQKQAPFGKRILKFAQKIKNWHLLRGSILWTIWIEHNDKLFHHEQWHESKMKDLIWDDLINYVCQGNVGKGYS